MTPATPARIHLMPAMESPQVVVIRRKPSKCFHIIRWDTQLDLLEHGSWFRGRVFSERCDVSFDGNWMIYMAMGSDGATWSGICRLPFLRTVAHGDTCGTWTGGGYWRDRRTLLLDDFSITEGTTPFKVRPMDRDYDGREYRGLCVPRLVRDGWVLCGDNYGATHGQRKNQDVECTGDDGWKNRPTTRHPWLIMRYRGYLARGHAYTFSLNKFPRLLDEHVDSACWDSSGNLVYSRLGVLYKYTLHDLDSGVPSSVHDIEHLTRDSK